MDISVVIGSTIPAATNSRTADSGMRQFGDLRHGQQPIGALWEPARSTDPDVPSLTHRVMAAIAHKTRWRQALDQARRDG